ncbi:uncharacterized protein BXZ73DRAFT_82889 [Epithele typhae]|uniref:uncharacterized protein n=1 Tax=Epithele typhae TaxID=378194 RepID=UPI002007B06B|nr:uncharacterized protein BXZ73DRAFT_82889 [Epithele typhae]KAH9911311.1 hypothetical protein BXZ73DRAFT_82889 [Epithele typhae]
MPCDFYRHPGHEATPDSRINHPQDDVDGFPHMSGIDSGGYIGTSMSEWKFVTTRLGQPFPSPPPSFEPYLTDSELEEILNSNFDEPPIGSPTTLLRVSTTVPNPCAHDADPPSSPSPETTPPSPAPATPVQPPRAPTPPPPAGAQARRSRRKHTADSDDEEWVAKRPRTALTDVDTNFVRRSSRFVRRSIPPRVAARSSSSKAGPSRVLDAPVGFGEDEEKENGIDEQEDDSEAEYGEPDPADKKGKGVARGSARAAAATRAFKGKGKVTSTAAKVVNKKSRKTHTICRDCAVVGDVECPFYGCNFVNSVKNMVDGAANDPAVGTERSLPEEDQEDEEGDAKKDAPAPKPLWPCKLEGCQRQSRPYSGYESLRRHHEEVHLKWMFLCPVQGCSVTCTREDTLRRHVLLIHKELNPEGENPESPEDDENPTAGKKPPRRTGPSKK